MIRSIVIDFHGWRGVRFDAAPLDGGLVLGWVTVLVDRSPVGSRLQTLCDKLRAATNKLDALNRRLAQRQESDR